MHVEPVLRDTGIGSAHPGDRMYVVIRQIARGFRLRRFVANEPSLDVDLTEAEIHWIYDHYAAVPDGKLAEVERSMRGVLARRGDR